MRIDAFLASEGICSSRTEAKNLISEGAVFINGRMVTKPSQDFSGCSEDVFVDKSVKRFVSRGGLKLEAALICFKIDCTARLCLDVGASSGGFTDCLLKNGARRVVAVDSGRGQLVESLRADERVVSVESFNARYMKPEDFDFVPELVVMDVSFISATYIIPAISRCIKAGGDFVCLIKPQFEVGKDAVGKGGIVKSDKARDAAVARVIDCASEHGFSCMGYIKSPIKGGDGNVEFLAHFVKSEE